MNQNMFLKFYKISLLPFLISIARFQSYLYQFDPTLFHLNV